MLHNHQDVKNSKLKHHLVIGDLPFSSNFGVKIGLRHVVVYVKRVTAHMCEHISSHTLPVRFISSAHEIVLWVRVVTPDDEG
jgi:hypothetical protein